MAWITPEAWPVPAPVTNIDLGRIEGNIDYIRNQNADLFGTKKITINPSGGAPVYAGLTIENNTTVGFNILTPSNSSAIIAFGDQNDSDVGFIAYNHTNDKMQLGAGASLGVELYVNKMDIFKRSFINLDVTGSVLNSQLVIKGVIDGNKKLLMGYDTTLNVGMIQSIEETVAVRSLAINPSGGNILIGVGFTDTGESLQLGGDSWYNGVVKFTGGNDGTSISERARFLGNNATGRYHSIITTNNTTNSYMDFYIHTGGASGLEQINLLSLDGKNSKIDFEGNINPTTTPTLAQFSLTTTPQLIPRGCYVIDLSSGTNYTDIEMQTTSGIWVQIASGSAGRDTGFTLFSDGINMRIKSTTGADSIYYRKF